jgi:hypothetical protein
VVDNVVYRTRESVHIWYSNRNNTVENNIFVDGIKTQINYTNPEDRGHEGIRLRRNIIVYGGESNPANDDSLYLVAGRRSLPIESDHNLICYRGQGPLRIERLEGIEVWEQWRLELGLDQHSLVADPGFVDPDDDDYSLREDSPAFALGFHRIDLSTVGLRGRR